MYANQGVVMESWLSIDPTEGTVSPGNTFPVGVGFNAAGMNGGDYSANIIVASNDPSNTEVPVSIQLTVIGAPDISVDMTSINFQPIFVNYTDTSGFVISNDGTDNLEVSNISVDNPVFTVSPSSTTLTPGENQAVQVVFAPTSTGDFSGTITLSTNDTDEGTVSIPVSGSANEPPVIAVSVSALSDSLLTGDTSSQTFTITNDGSSDLTFSISIQDEATRLRHAQINDLIEHTDITGDYPEGAYPASMGPAPLYGVPVAESEEPADFAFLLEANGHSIEAANNFVTSFDLSAPEILPNLGSNPAGAGFFGAGSFGKDDQSHYYFVSHSGSNLWKLDTTLVTAEDLGTLSVGGGQSFAGLATDPTDGTLYGVTTNCSASNLVILNPETGDVTTVGSTGLECAIAIAIDADGIIYTYDIKADNMYTLDKETGANTLLGSIGFDANYGQGMSYDNYTGQIYMAAYNNSTQAAELRVVDSQTGGTTLIGGIGSSDPGGSPQLGFVAIPGEFVNWLTTNPTEGTVSPGGSLTVTVNFDAAGLDGGDYSSDIVIASNDPSNPATSVNIQLNVTGAPNINIVEAILSFGEIFAGYSDSLELAIENSGSDTLSVTSIAIDNDVFTLSHSSATINAGEVFTLGIDFMPATAGDFSGTITIISNDADEDTIMVGVSGSAIIPPVAAADPLSFTMDLVSGEQYNSLLTISNTGGSNLNYNISTSSGAYGSFVDSNPSDEESPLRRLFYSPPTSFNTEPNILLEYDTGEVIDGIYCGVAEPEQEVLEQVRKSLNHWIASGGYQPQSRESILIPIAMHVIRYDDGSHDVEDSNIQAQIDVLNAGLATHNFQFELISIDRTDNTSWSTHAYGDIAEEDAMKSALAIDPISTFNFYLCDLQDGLLGYATFPFMYSEDSYMHGVVLHSESIPGGTLPPAYSTGDVGIHEAGHYIGLYHTFQGGCVEPGDEVDDTPYSAEPNWGCPEGIDSCPQEGLDPIHNYMDYSDGQCMDHFTPGQGERAHSLMSLYKPTMYANTASSDWLSINPTSGSIAPDTTALTTLTITTEGVYAGNYGTIINIDSNDPANPSITIPFELSVTGVAEIDVAQDTLSYGNVYAGNTETQEIQVSNLGTDVLHITGWSIVGEVFSSAQASSFDINPGSDEQISVDFTPSTAGTYTGTFTLESDDADEPSLVVTLEGTSSLPPSLSLSDTTISVSLAEGSSVSSSFLLANNGGVDLNFTIEIGGLENITEDDFETGFGNYSDISAEGNGTPWENGDADDAGSWFPDHTIFAFINDDAIGSSAPPANSNLASQVLDASGQMALMFDNFFPQYSGSCGSGSYSEDAKILISIDGGAYSEIIVPQATEWTETTIDLSSLSMTGSTIQVVFNYDDCGGNWAYGWGVDNARIQGVGGAQWLTLSPMEGSLPPGQDQNIDAVLNSEGYASGDYSVNVHVRDIAYMLDETIIFNMTVLDWLNTPPAAFALVSPADGEVVINLEPILQWDPALDPDTTDNVSYTIDFGSTIPNQTTIEAGTDTSYEFVDPLTNNTTYYWKVTANDEYGGSSESIGGWHTFTIDLLGEGDGKPVITDISDIPDDQGGWVYITFNRSYYDTDTLRSEVYQVERMDDSVWVGISNYSAYGADTYTIEARTLQDSTESDSGMTTFRVIADMDEGNYTSEPAEGYSVDNIAPSVPTGLLADVSISDVTLSWDEAVDEDFQYFTVYADGSLYTQLVDTQVDYEVPLDILEVVFEVTATDFHGNESEPASITVLLPISDNVALTQSWNLMSFDVDIENNSPEEVFADQIADSNLVYITGYDVDGAVFFDPYLPPFLNTLTSINPGFGYWVNLESTDEVSDIGLVLGLEYTITLQEDWNLVGYWPENSQAPVDAFAQLINENNLIGVTGYYNGALFFDPDLLPFLNTLSSLDNGFGYWIKINEAVEGFQYPAATTVLARTVPRETNPDIIKTNVFMFVNGSVAFDHIDYTIGDMVNVTTASGLLVGEMEILNNGLLMTGPIYGDDFTTEAVDGALKDETLFFTYGEYTSEPVSITFEGNMELTKIDLTFKNVPETFSLHQNYPNPFNPVTSIKYDLPEQTHVILTIYDLMGREVTQLINTSQEAGYKSVQWDATDKTGKPVSAGVYLYQIQARQIEGGQAGAFIQTKKMVLLK